MEESYQDDKTQTRLSIYIKEDLHQRLKLLASYDDKSITNIVCYAVEEYLQTRADDIADEQRRAQQRNERKAQQRKNDKSAS